MGRPPYAARVAQDRDRDSAGWRGAAGGVFAVAWGANQFVSLLVAYREQRGISVAVNDGLFGIYAVGLVLALLLGGPAADLWGRTRLMRPAVLVSLAATVLLMVGSGNLALLFAGRFVAGGASGVVLAAGTAWVKELSAAPFDPRSTAETGARRGAIALSLGFGLGPLVTGLVAQWAPAPLVTAYIPHLVIVALTLPALWQAPETVTVGGQDSVGFRRRLRVSSAGHPRFRGVVAPTALWVFAGPSIAFAVLAPLVSTQTRGYGTVFAGVVAGLTLGVGVATQQLARRIHSPGGVRGATVGLLATAAGLLVGALAAQLANPVVVLVASVLLGVGYGLELVSGLRETQRLAAPGELAGLTAIYYTLTYLGFALPVMLAGLSALLGYPALLCCLAALSAVSLLVVRVQSVRHPI